VSEGPNAMKFYTLLCAVLKISTIDHAPYVSWSLARPELRANSLIPMMAYAASGLAYHPVIEDTVVV
jgi:hypothetical protein